MIDHLQETIRQWNIGTSERQKLQHTYALLAVGVTFLAGIVSFFDGSKGHRLMYVAFGAAGAFVANGVVWHLLHSVVLAKLPKSSKKR